MNDQEKSREQLIAELVELRQRVAESKVSRNSIGDGNAQWHSTDHKRAETALQESEECFRRIFEEGPLGVVLAGLNGRIQQVNRRFCDLLGYSEREIIELGIEGFTHPDDHQLDEHSMARMLRGEIPSYTLKQRFLRQDGQVRWGQVTVSLLRDAEGTPTHAIGMIEDITERRQAEQAVSQSEQKMRLHVLQTPLAVIEWDVNARVTRWNPGAERIFGYIRDEALGRHFTLMVPPEFREHVDHLWTALLVSKGGERSTNENVTKDGRTILCQWYNTPLVNAEGQAIGVASLAEDITARKQSGELEAIEGFTIDITDRKRAEQELQQANERLEERIRERTAELTEVNELLQAEVEQRRQVEKKLAVFQRFVEAGTQGFGMADVDGRVIYANPFWVRLFGASTSEEVIGKHLSPYYPPEYLLRREKEIIPALRRKEHWQGEQVLIFPDGRMHPTIHTVFPVLNDDGELLCTAAVITDITELKQAEQALRQSEERYRTVLEDQTEVICRLTHDGTFAFVNEVFCRFFGKTSQELLGKKWQQVALPGDLPMIEEQLRAVSPDNPIVVIENRVYSGLGEVHWMQFVNRGFFDQEGRLAEIQTVGRDITERKRAETVMRQTLAQLETIYGGMIEGLLITDVETKRFVRVNTSFCRMLGYSEEELLAASIKDIHPADEIPNDLRRFQAAAEGQVSINEDRPVLRKDGSIFFADITGHRIVYDERPCLLALFRDVTERKQAAEKLKAEQRALRRMVLAGDHERRLITYELHDGVAQQLLGAMIYLQSQELPMAPKSKAAETAYREGLEALRRAASEIRRVMNRLRTPVLDKYGLAEAIEDVAVQLRLTPGAPEIEYRHAVNFKRLEPTLENSLFRIAQEAMTNACRHSKSKKVHVKLTQKGHDVILEVRDWGIGFDRETAQDNRFGLEGIRERCRILGGKLSIKSKVGQGTVVQAKFPVIEATDEELSLPTTRANGASPTC